MKRYEAPLPHIAFPSRRRHDDPPRCPFVGTLAIDGAAGGDYHSPQLRCLGAQHIDESRGAHHIGTTITTYLTEGLTSSGIGSEMINKLWSCLGHDPPHRVRVGNIASAKNDVAIDFRKLGIFAVDLGQQIVEY